jgi:hypothetical protein
MTHHSYLQCVFLPVIGENVTGKRGFEKLLIAVPEAIF